MPSGLTRAGGRLTMQYANLVRSYELSVPLCAISSTPSGADNDYRYVGGGPKTPTESGVIATFAAFGLIWQTYYDSSWVLSLKSVWYQSGADGYMLPVVPAAANIIGGAGSATPTDPPLRRGFSFRSVLGNVMRIRLFDLQTNDIGSARFVTPSSGGYDGRDQALVGYLSGVDTGLVLWDGQPFPPMARAYMRFQTIWATPTGLTLSGDYLVNG